MNGGMWLTPDISKAGRIPLNFIIFQKAVGIVTAAP
jgi:hypothetical protein